MLVKPTQTLDSRNTVTLTELLNNDIRYKYVAIDQEQHFDRGLCREPDESDLLVKCEEILVYLHNCQYNSVQWAGPF